jgi:hypothetical protein
MATFTKFKIGGQETTPFRGANDVTISANFNLEAQPDISIDEPVFSNSENGLNYNKVLSLWQQNPLEGGTFSYSVYDGTNYKDFNFFFDWNRLNFLSDTSLSCGLVRDTGLNQFNFRAQGITMRSLKFQDVIVDTDLSDIPYVIRNRKTDLEKIQLLYQTYVTIKTGIDEVFKIINIASDITTLGVAQAVINLAQTVAGLIVLFQRLSDLIIELQETFFPFVRYHKGIKPSVFIRKAVQYMGYDDVDFGTLTDLMDELHFLPSKNNEKGSPSVLASLNFQGEGLLKPNEEGYVLFDMKELIKRVFNCHDAVINNVYHLRPKSDPFWISQSTYVLPNVLVDNTDPVNNGTYRPNYEDLTSNTIIEFATDDSDLWTLDDLASETSNTTGKIISVAAREPENVNDQRKVILKGSKQINIPYCLPVRSNLIGDLLANFGEVSDNFQALFSKIEERFNEFTSELGQAMPALAPFVDLIENRDGVCVIENHFFSVPKMVILRNNENGVPRIPDDYVDIIGAESIYNNWHLWDSFIAGNRPNINESAAKLIYENVRIHFTLQDFVKVENNAYFTDCEGRIGKFISVDWSPMQDTAICSWWVYDNWMSNLKEDIV